MEKNALVIQIPDRYSAFTEFDNSNAMAKEREDLNELYAKTVILFDTALLAADMLNPRGVPLQRLETAIESINQAELLDVYWDRADSESQSDITGLTPAIKTFIELQGREQRWNDDGQHHLCGRAPTGCG